MDVGVLTLPDRILAAVEAAGLLLVHDRVFPSVTMLVAGEPVAGSWWAHPQGKAIYNALEALEGRVWTIKLLLGKETLVARALWPHLAAVGRAREAWQMDGLSPEALALLDRLDEPLVVTPALRQAARELERRLLAPSVSVHSASGHHVRALRSWESWCAEHLSPTPIPEPTAARAALAARSPRPGARVFPWESE